MTKTNKNYFGKYFRYKLGQSKPIFIIFALLNFFTAVILPHFLLVVNYNHITTVNPDDPYELIAIQEFSSAFTPMFVAVIIGAIMITVTTVWAMNIYHDRAAMDTLGSLPLSYRERFWGDVLSSMFVNFVSFVPSFVISVIIESSFRNTVRQNFIRYNTNYSSVKVISHSVTVFLLLTLISYIGVYAVTAFVKSCCGRFGTAVMFSLIAMIAIPGIYAVYGNYIYSYAVGVDMSNEICSKIGLLPPFGFIFSLGMRKLDAFLSFEEVNNLDYLIDRPVCIILPVLIIAAFFAGAYYVGKNRKAEKTGEGFVFNSAFYVLLISLLVMVFGLTSSYLLGEKGAFGLLVIVPLSFVLYFALEFSQHKSFKGSWKTVIRYAAVLGACIAFMTAVRATGAFGFSKKLPSESSIKEIHVSGEYFSSEYGVLGAEGHTYRSADSVSAILNEHKKLLEEDDLKTGYKLVIRYVTKGGREITRGYNMFTNGDEPIKNFSYAVRDLKEFDPSILGVLGRTDFNGLGAKFYCHDSDDHGLPSGYLRRDKTEEFAEILRSDIENFYFYDGEAGKSTVGDVRFYNIKDNYQFSLNTYMILDVYEATIEFLSDPENYVVSDKKDEPKIYHVSYKTNGLEGTLSNISVTVSKDDTSEYAKELLSYIKPTHSINSTPPCFIIRDENGDIMYEISRENEQAAIKAMLDLLREIG